MKSKLAELKEFRRRLIKGEREIVARLRAYPNQWPRAFTLIFDEVVGLVGKKLPKKYKKLNEWLEDLRPENYATHFPALFSNSIAAIDARIAELEGKYQSHARCGAGRFDPAS